MQTPASAIQQPSARQVRDLFEQAGNTFYVWAREADDHRAFRIRRVKTFNGIVKGLTLTTTPLWIKIGSAWVQ